MQDFLQRFESIPDMLELDHLTVSGDVTFGKQVTLKVNNRGREGEKGTGYCVWMKMGIDGQTWLNKWSRSITQMKGLRRVGVDEINR